LIGPSRHGQTLELGPRDLLLIAEPGGQLIVRATRPAAQNPGRFWRDFGHSFEDG
jgi:hypothetical protein